MLIGWERLLRLFPPKWFLLVFFGGAVLGMMQLAYPGGLIAFVIDTFAYNQQTGWGRTEILEYGSATVLRTRSSASASPRTGARPGGGRRRWTTTGWWWRCATGCRRSSSCGSGIALARGADDGPPRPRRGGRELPQGLL